MEQLRIELIKLIGDGVEQMTRQIEALQALQANDDDAMENILFDAYEEEKAKTMEIDAKIKDVRSAMLN